MPTELLLELSGNDADLKELTECFSLPECQVIRHEGKYCLTSERFNSLTELDILKEGKNLVKMINGLAKLRISNWFEIKIASHLGQ
jgi:hypothetical protein